MRLRTGVMILVSTAVCVAFSACGRGSFDYGVLAIGLIFFCMFLTVIGLVMLFFGRWTEVKCSGDWLWTLAAAAAVGCLLSLPIGEALNRSDMAEARRFCEDIRPELERYKATTGRYPERLSEVPLPARRPRLLDRHVFYWVQPDGDYNLLIADPSGLMNGIGHSSRSTTWREWD